MGLFYSRGADFIEISIRDYTGRLIEKYKCSIMDKKACSEIMKKLKDKYDFEPMIDEKKWINSD